MEMPCAKSSVLSRAGPSQCGPRVRLCCDECQDAGREAVRTWRRRTGGVGGGRVAGDSTYQISGAGCRAGRWC